MDENNFYLTKSENLRPNTDEIFRLGKLAIINCPTNFKDSSIERMIRLAHLSGIISRFVIDKDEICLHDQSNTFIVIFTGKTNRDGSREITRDVKRV